MLDTWNKDERPMSIIPARLLSAKSVYIVLSCGDLDRMFYTFFFRKYTESSFVLPNKKCKKDFLL